MKVIDECLGKLYDSSIENNYVLIITADHGNAEEMYNIKEGKKVVKTSHTLNPVPFIICDERFKLKDGSFGLSNVAATIIEILGYEKNPKWNESMLDK